MGKVNVYLPDDLEEAVRAASLPVSAVCQEALRAALERVAAARAGEPAGMTADLRAVLDHARVGAGSLGRAEATTDDIFGALGLGNGLGARALQAMGVDLPVNETGRSRRSRHRPDLAPDARELLAAAAWIALEMRDSHVGTEHLAVALTDVDTAPGQALAALGITAGLLRQQIDHLRAEPETAERVPPEPLEERAVLDRLDAEVQRLAAELASARQRLRG